MSSIVSSSPGLHPPIGLGLLASPHEESLSNSLGQTKSSLRECDDIELLSVFWNQDYGCFAAGTNHGFRVYSCDPFQETFRRDLKTGGFGIVEMLFRSNIVALVGGGTNTNYPTNKVVIWDDHLDRCVSELTFRSNICAVKLRNDHIVVVLEHRIYIYNFKNFKLVHQIETLNNPKGLCCLSQHLNTFVLACPGLQKGQVHIEHFSLKVTKIIDAHDSRIACLTLTMDGLLLATASAKGTLIRIFNTMDGSCLQEVRRGADKAEIYSIALSPNIHWLAASSDKGTIHIFSLSVRVDGVNDQDGPNQGLPIVQNKSDATDASLSRNTRINRGSSFSFIKGILPRYFSSEWSFAQFHVPEATRFLVGFGAQNTVAIVGMDGSFYRCSFDPIKGGEMTQQSYVRFLQTGVSRERPSAI